MRIVYLYTALSTMGGADRIITQKMNYFAETLGFDVYLITDSQNNLPFVFPLSNKITHIDTGTNFDKQYKYSFIPRMLCYKKLMRHYKKAVQKLLAEIKPDIVITTLGRDMDFLTSLNDGSKKIGESHISRRFLRNYHLLEKKGSIYKWLVRYLRWKQAQGVKKLDGLVVLTNADACEWEHVISPVVIPNPLTLQRDTKSSCTNQSVISVGRYSEQKGYDMLVQAWVEVAKQYPQWHLNLYGEGALRNELEKQIETLHLQNFITLNSPVTDIKQKYLDSSIYVMSSRFEGFGLVLIEAMTCGLPCVSFNCPSGPAEIIKNDEDGILVDNGDVSKLASALCLLIEDENRRKAMGEKAFMNAERFSIDNIMNSWTGLFESVLSSR